MSRHAAREGDGTAWLVADGAEPTGFHCYWYTGRAEDHLVERAHLPTEAAAVAWGRTRTPRVRIRTSDRRSSWAGTAPRPAGIALTWIEPAPLEGTESC
jgi:hypothetical protein